VKTTIVFQPEDKTLPQLCLECTYSFHEGEPMVMYGDNPYPGSPAGVEVESVRCVGVDHGDGQHPKDAIIGDIIGSLCYLAAPREIDKLVMEAHCEASQVDPDRERE